MSLSKEHLGLKGERGGGNKNTKRQQIELSNDIHHIVMYVKYVLPGISTLNKTTNHLKGVFETFVCQLSYLAGLICKIFLENISRIRPRNR